MRRLLLQVSLFALMISAALRLQGFAQAQTSLTRMSLHEAQLGLIKGQRAISKGQYSEGISQLTRILRARALPKDQAAQAFYDRGLAYQSMQQFNEAARDYSQALALNTLSGTYRARALYNRGLTQVNLGNQNAAMSDFSNAIQAAPDLPQAYYQRGKLLSAAGKQQQAITDFKTAIAKRMPSSEWAWYEMAKAQAATGQWALAHNALSSALQINPNFSEARQQLAIVQNNLQYSQNQTAPQQPQAKPQSPYTDPIVTNSTQRPTGSNIQAQQTGQWDKGGLVPNTRQYSQIPPTRLSANQASGARSLYVPGPGFDAARKATPVKAARPAQTQNSIKVYVMQLSAHNDVSTARGTWTILYNRNADILGGLSPLIQKGVSATGHSFYRLRTGPFPQKADGMTLCQALKARGQDCFVTYVK
mgnify:CR=1 FL=1